MFYFFRITPLRGGNDAKKPHIPTISHKKIPRNGGLFLNSHPSFYLSFSLRNLYFCHNLRAFVGEYLYTIVTIGWECQI